MPSLLCRSQILIGSEFGQYIPTVVHTVRELQLWTKEIEWRHPSTKGSYCEMWTFSSLLFRLALAILCSDGVRVRQLRSGGTAKVKGLNPGLVWGPKKLLWNPFSNNECETFGCSSTGWIALQGSHNPVWHVPTRTLWWRQWIKGRLGK